MLLVKFSSPYYGGKVYVNPKYVSHVRAHKPIERNRYRCGNKYTEIDILTKIGIVGVEEEVIVENEIEEVVNIINSYNESDKQNISNVRNVNEIRTLNVED